MPIFLHENNAFRLPEDTNCPIIMIGPGTGIAPFRAFLEERQAMGQKGDNWLFFGEQRSFSDYLYKDQFLAMEKDGLLTQAAHGVLARPGQEGLRAGPHAGKRGGAVRVARTRRVLLCVRRCQPHGEGR